MDQRNLLYIDDEPENLTVFEFSFHKYYKIYTALTTSEGMGFIENNPVEVVVSDQRMPGKTGIEFFEELAVSHPNIIRIILTAYSEIDAVIDSINKGKVYHYLNKPYDINNFKNILDKAFETYNLRKENYLLIRELQAKNEVLLQALEISEHNEIKFRNIFQTSQDAIAIISVDQIVLEANAIWLEKSGYTLDEFRSFKFLKIVPEAYKVDIATRFRKILNGENTHLYELEILTKRNEFMPVEINSRLIDYFGNPAVLSIIRDITDRKKMQQTLMNITIEVEEHERKKLASDLHDEVGPLLSSMKMMLSTLIRKPEVEPYKTLIIDITNIMKETIATVREISYNISPHVLNYHGLSAALRNFFETKKGLVEISFENNIDGIRFQETVELMVYRILKELFNNTIKYANADKLTIAVFQNNNLLEVLYRDNGIGFDAGNLHQSTDKGMGMQSIVNRIHSIGGTYVVNTKPDAGFELSISINLNQL